MTTLPDKLVTDNGDETVTIRLAKDTLVLPSPTASQYAKIYDYILEADENLPRLTLLDPANVTAEQIEVRRDELKARRAAEHSASAPHAIAMLRIIELLSDSNITMDDLHRGWMKPQAVGALIELWEAPLGGDSPPQGQPLTVVPPAPLDSAEDAPSSPPGTGDASPSRQPTSTP